MYDFRDVSAANEKLKERNGFNGGNLFNSGRRGGRQRNKTVNNWVRIERKIFV